MAKQIIVLGKTTNGATDNLSLVFWYAISSGALVRTNGSEWSGASTAENTAIQNGTVLEEQQAFSFPVGTATTTIKDVLNKAWALRNSQINGIGPAQYAGVFFDSSTGWSA